MKLDKLIKKLNKENSPPDGWSAADAVPKWRYRKNKDGFMGSENRILEKEDKPQPGKVYSLTGGPGTPSIAAGNTWAESLVKEEK
jgi:hypothetical protein